MDESAAGQPAGRPAANQRASLQQFHAHKSTATIPPTFHVKHRIGIRKGNCHRSPARPENGVGASGRNHKIQPAILAGVEPLPRSAGSGWGNTSEVSLLRKRFGPNNSWWG